MQHDVTHHAALALLWNRLHHRAWEHHRVTRAIGQHDGRNPYPPRPRTATITRAPALDTTDCMIDTARILGTRWPEEHPGLPHPIAIELTREAYRAWGAALSDAAAVTFAAALGSWPHSHEAKLNRHGNLRTRIVAPPEAVEIGLTLVERASVRPFDAADLELAYISEADLLELERATGAACVNPTQERRAARALQRA